MAAKKKITLTDVSRSAGVSLSTVSMILNARADVTFSPETVLKVRRTAEELGYKAPTRRSFCLPERPSSLWHPILPTPITPD